MLTRVANALALVGLGLAQLADVGRDLADQLLVDARHSQLRRALDGEGDPFGGLERDGVGEPELELELGRALGQDAVPTPTISSFFS